MPVEPKSVGGGGNLEDSDMKGVSSLLKMKKEGWRKVGIKDGSDGDKDKAEGLGFVLRGIDMNEEGDINRNGLIDDANKDPNKEKSIDKRIGDAQYPIGDFVLGKPIIRSGGLKENACVADLGIEKLPISSIFEPLDLLTILKTVGQAPNNASNLPEISNLKNWVLDFYRSKGVYHFAEYSDPKVIEGLEDPEKDAEENGVMGRNQGRGPVEEDEGLKACSSGNGRMRKRKQKSIAEILQISKTAAKSVCKTRKVGNLTESATPTSKMGDARKKGKGPDSAEESSQKSEDSSLKGYSSRERKKSKYLSSPYKNPTKLEGKGNAAKVSRVLSLDPEDKKKKMKKKTFAKNVLSEIQTLGADPDFLNKTKSFPLVEQFLRDFRTSVNSANESSDSDLNSERLLVKQKKRGRKAKNNGGTDSSKTESSKKRIKKNEAEDEDLDVDAPIINLIKGRKKKKEKDDLGARLLVSFGQGCPLPTKEDLTNIYGKFGPLNDTDTRMYENNFCGIVAFERTSDAESALISSKKSNPFGSADASFVLRCLSPTNPRTEVEASAAKKKRSLETANSKVVEANKTETPNKKKKKLAAGEEEEGNKVGEVEFVKKKLEDMSALLDKPDGNLSKKVRSKLEGELKGVLKKLASGGPSSSST